MGDEYDEDICSVESMARRETLRRKVQAFLQECCGDYSLVDAGLVLTDIGANALAQDVDSAEQFTALHEQFVSYAKARAVFGPCKCDVCSEGRRLGSERYEAERRLRN